MYKVTTYYQEDQTAIFNYTLTCRSLWDEHIDYTRNATISILADLLDVDAVTARLMKNQEDIGNVFRPYYGDMYADSLTALLKQHIAIAASIVTGIKNSQDVSALLIDWQNNGKAIADLLNEMNPMYWSTYSISGLLNQHMNETVAQAQYRMLAKWEDDIAASDNNHKIIYELSDMLAKGIVWSYPEKFCK